ncbi:hypothetical protein F5887DRAFT_991166, partial [Amanita rubescens]
TRTGVERNTASTSLVHVGLPPTPFHLVWPLLLQIYLSTRPHLPLLPPNFLLPTEKIIAAAFYLLSSSSSLRPYWLRSALEVQVREMPLWLCYCFRFRHTAASCASRAFHSAYAPAVPFSSCRSNKEIGRENSVEVDVTLVHDKSTPEDIASRCRVVKTMTTLDMMHTGSCASTNDPFRIPAY